MKVLSRFLLIGLLALSAAVVLAQQEVDINDGRVNENELLGGIGIYCEDQSGQVSNTYTNGGISVWGPEGQKYIYVSSAEIANAQRQFPQNELSEGFITQSDQAQQGAAGDTASDSQMDSSMMDDQTRTERLESLRIGNQNTGLLARADTPRGQYSLYASGGETFYLIGTDQYGRPFLYRWIGCTNANATVSIIDLPEMSTGRTNQSRMTSTPSAEATDMVMPTEMASTPEPTVTATPNS